MQHLIFIFPYSPKSLDKVRKMTEQAKSRQAMSPRSGYHQFITDVHYFQGEGEEHEVSVSIVLLLSSGHLFIKYITLYLFCRTPFQI